MTGLAGPDGAGKTTPFLSPRIHGRDRILRCDTIDGWDELRAEALRDRNRRTADDVLGLPLLLDYLEEALSQFGLSCDELDEADRE